MSGGVDGDTTAGDEYAVVLEDLVKRYPKRPTNAVDGVSFAVRPGEVFGLLGPNGAGKTTTVGVLTTRVRPTSGSAQVAGIDVVRNPVAAKRRLAVVPQRANLDRALSARQNLLFHAAYFGVGAQERTRRANVLLEEFGLLDRADDKVDYFSGGQSQRIMIARALMHEPQVLFLDEPTTGLDPQARLFVWDRIRDLKSRGVTMILTTHDMDEAAELCDRVAIMDRGKLLALDTPAALTATVPGKNSLGVGVALHGCDQTVLVEAMARLAGVERAEPVTKTAPGPPAGNLWAAAFGGGGGGGPGRGGGALSTSGGGAADGGVAARGNGAGAQSSGVGDRGTGGDDGQEAWAEGDSTRGGRGGAHGAAGGAGGGGGFGAGTEGGGRSLADSGSGPAYGGGEVAPATAAGEGPVHVRLYASVDAPALVAPVARLIDEHGGELIDLSIAKPSLEDVFIHLTGRALR